MARSLPRSLAAVVEELELEQPRVVTVGLIEAIVGRAPGGAAEPSRVAYELQRRGWLGRLRTRGAWEFLPGARAGAHGSGDRFIELRALLMLRPEVPVALAMESAAALNGLAQRVPDREVLWLGSLRELPRSLSEFRSVHLALPNTAHHTIDGLPVWRVEALLTGIATRPSSYRDLAGLAQWLPDAGHDLNHDLLLECLQQANAATRQRMIYLLQLTTRRDLAVDLAGRYPPQVPVWFGATRTGGRFDQLSRVIDADLAPFMTAGVGA